MSSYYTSGATASLPTREFRDYVQLSGYGAGLPSGSYPPPPGTFAPSIARGLGGYGVLASEIGTPGFPAEPLGAWRGREDEMTAYQAKVVQWAKSPFYAALTFNKTYTEKIAEAARALKNLRTVISSIHADTRPYSRTIEGGMRIWYKVWRRNIREAQGLLWTLAGGPTNPSLPRPLAELPMLPEWTPTVQEAQAAAAAAKAGDTDAAAKAIASATEQKAADAKDQPSPAEKTAASTDAADAAAAGDQEAAKAADEASRKGGVQWQTVALAGGASLGVGLLVLLIAKALK